LVFLDLDLVAGERFAFNLQFLRRAYRTEKFRRLSSATSL